MDTAQHIIDQIPIRHNGVSYFMFLGVFLGLFLGLVILLRATGRNATLKLLGWFLITHSLVLLDTFLCYTGLMKYTIRLNDSTEPLVLLWPPLIYLFIQNLLEGKPFTFKQHWFHFVIPVLYFFTQFGYYLHPSAVKLNAYLNAYFPEMVRAPEPDDLSFGYQVIKDELRRIILISSIVYIGLSVRVVLKNKHRPYFARKKQGISKYSFSKNTVGIFIGLLLFIFTIFWKFENDLGDHYIGMLQTLFVFFVSFTMLSESRFFENSWIAEKYETLKLKGEALSVQEIKKYVEEEQYYLLSSASLKDLSARLNTNANYLSKIINAGTGVNFNDFINQYRVTESEKRLLDENYAHLTIEAIGNSVGFKSRSAFYKAFKKYKNTSPSLYLRTKKATTSR